MAATDVKCPVPSAGGIAMAALISALAATAGLSGCSGFRGDGEGASGSGAAKASATLSRNVSTPELRRGDVGETDLRVMSFNLRYDTADDGDHRWSMRRERVAHVIRESGAAIIGTQEGLAHQVEWLDEALPNHLHLGVGRDDGMSKGEFTAIFIDTTQFDILESGTFWLSDTPDSPSVGWDAALPRICTFAVLVPAGRGGSGDGGGDGGSEGGEGEGGGGGGESGSGGDGSAVGGAEGAGAGAQSEGAGVDFDDLSTEFADDLLPVEWFDLKADEGDLSTLGNESPFAEGAFIVMNAHYDHIGAEARANASRLILRIMDEIGRTLPVILLGDFNAEPGTEPITTLLEELSDAYDAPGVRRSGPAGTFNGFEDREAYDARIDYVFHSRDLVPLTHLVFDRRIEGLFPSDHFPVIVDLRWNR